MPGYYAPDGSINVTVTDGSVRTGLIAPDGSVYVVKAAGGTPVGAYHPSGGWWVTPNPGAAVGLRANDGSLNVQTSPFTPGQGKNVNVVSGSFNPGGSGFLPGGLMAVYMG